MTALDNANTLVSATRVLGDPRSGYPAPVAVGIAQLFSAYIELNQPAQLEGAVMRLADAVLHPLVVEGGTHNAEMINLKGEARGDRFAGPAGKGA